MESGQTSRGTIGAVVLLLLLAGAAPAGAPPEHGEVAERSREVAGTAPSGERDRAGVAAVPAPRSDEVTSLREELQALLGAGGWRDAEWSVLALSLENGDTLIAANPHQALAPASNMKLLTTAAALHYLGPDYRYSTFLLSDAPVSAGRLQGDLVLYGTGDPGLGDRFWEDRDRAFQELADQLVASGITAIEGDVVGDASYFQGPTRAAGWDPRDLNDWFAAPAAALSFNENVVTLRIVPTAPGSPAQVRTIPEDAEVALVNRALTAGAGGTTIRIRREDPSGPIVVDGQIRAGAREVWRQMTVGEPARFAAGALARVLEERGIRVLGGVRAALGRRDSPLGHRRIWAPAAGRSAEAPSPRILARVESPPLLEYLEVVNKRSHNLLAEMTLMTLGRVAVGEGSYQGGSRALRGFLADAAEVDTSSVRVVDGSGLSSLNRVSAAQFIELLRHMSGSPLWEPFWQTLPEAGNPRGLRRMYRTAAAGNLRAKTGTIERVSALSGIVRSASGERIAFSILSNRVPSTSGAKRIEDRIGSRLAALDRPLPSPEPVRLATDPSGVAAVPGGGEGGVATEDEPAEARARAEASAPEPTVTAAAPDAGREASSTGAGEGEPPEPRVHRVRQGESFSVIARSYDVSTDALMAANPELSPRGLLPGTELRIPGVDRAGEPVSPLAPPTEATRHRVRAGESLWDIARAYGVTLDELEGANPGLDPRRLQVGASVRIPAARRGGAG